MIFLLLYTTLFHNCQNCHLYHSDTASGPITTARATDVGAPITGHSLLTINYSHSSVHYDHAVMPLCVNVQLEVPLNSERCRKAQQTLKLIRKAKPSFVPEADSTRKDWVMDMPRCIRSRRMETVKLQREVIRFDSPTGRLRPLLYLKA
ncbi:hypothetical protein BDN71DRAFT_218757 [Pleurotus eryngii]|uniref:Uncharacterized protein n=1 Tax=Pleurotus eryngii TaxID=5323 RepID=A0A9P5ZLV3_PLEER|nr:hypothetical protein BDN71DRAFT_218757 [Pleurotus eryngii]